MNKGHIFLKSKLLLSLVPLTALLSFQVESSHAMRGKGKQIDGTVNIQQYFQVTSSKAPKNAPDNDTVDPIVREGIYQQALRVSDKFLSSSKREHIEENAHTLLARFQQEYDTNQISNLDITGLSARARIYLLREITEYKLRRFNAVNPQDDIYWKQNPEKNYEYLDQLPVTFRIGNHIYTLMGAWTKDKPGGGKLKGLTSPYLADKYNDILKKLRDYSETELKAVKKQMVDKKQNGGAIEILSKMREKFLERKVEIPNMYVRKYQELDQFTNGLSLLFDFEVARRRINGDVHQRLPVITALPYMLENFEDTNVLSYYFYKIFSDPKNEEVGFSDEIKNCESAPLDRASAISFKLLRANLKDKPAIRGALKVLHKDAENSGDETY